MKVNGEFNDEGNLEITYTVENEIDEKQIRDFLLAYYEKQKAFLESIDEKQVQKTAK